MLDDLLKQIGVPLDVSKLAATVDAVWDQREYLGDAVKFVSENKDHLTTALQFVQDHGDDLLDLARRLPELLGHAGTGIEAAGLAASTASKFLAGGDGDAVGADGVLAFAATALERCQALVQDAGSLVASVSDRLEKIPLIDDAAATLRAGGERFDDLAGQLSEVAQRFSALGSRLAEAGGDLNHAGSQLQASGGTLRSFAGGAGAAAPVAALGLAGLRSKADAAPRPLVAEVVTKPAKKTAAPKKAAAKKSAAKKAPAKPTAKKPVVATKVATTRSAAAKKAVAAKKASKPKKA